MESNRPLAGAERSGQGAVRPDGEQLPAASGNIELLDTETERSARERLFDEVLASVELVLVADGAGFWREEPDHSLVLTASRSLPQKVLDAFDRHVTAPLQSIMLRWPESPLVAVPLNDPTNPIAEEIRQITERQGIVGLAGVPCRVPGEMMGILIVVHRRPHPWTVRDLGLATGLAGQLATAMQNARLYTSVRALANRLSALHELSLRLARLRDPATIADAIVGEASRVVDCDTVRLYQAGPDGAYRPVAAAGTFLGIESPPLDAISGSTETLPLWVAKRNEPLIIPDVTVERRAIFRTAFGPESLLLVPMAYGDEVEGVLVVTKQGTGRFKQDDEEALSIFARYAAQSLINARNLQELQRQRELLELQLAAERRLLSVSEQLVSTLDPSGVLDQIADTIGSVVRFDRLTVYRTDRLSGRIEPVLSRTSSGSGDGAESRTASSGDPAGDKAAQGPNPDTTSSRLDEGLTSWVIGRGDPVCANDVPESVLAKGVETGAELRPRDRRGAGGRRATVPAGHTQNIIVLPLRVRGEVIGSLNLIRFGGPSAHFSEHEFEICKLFAGQASLALQNAEAHVTVAARADLDALTGLRNHGTFQRDLSALVDEGERFSLLMMDLDSFKAFNDTYGHPAGDMLLVTVAGAIVGAIRHDDRAYRYGGDEFALLLRRAPRKHAEEVAERVRSAIREAVVGTSIGLGVVDVTASVGVACWPTDGRSKTRLVEAADADLYRAKRARVVQPTGPAASSRGGRGGRSRPASPATRASAPDRSEETLSTLLAAAQDLAAATDVESTARIVMRHVSDALGARDAYVALARDSQLPPALRGSGTGSDSSNGQSGIEDLPHLVAGLGTFAHAGNGHGHPSNGAGSERIDGLWRRVVDAGGILWDCEAGGSREVAAPLMAGGRAVGMVVVKIPAGDGRSDEKVDGLDALPSLLVLGTAALEKCLRAS